MASPLESLPQEILLHICRAMYECEPPGSRHRQDWLREGITLPQSLNALSRTNRKFRNICLPMVFNRITMRGRDEHIVERIGQMKVVSAETISHVSSLTLIHWSGFLWGESYPVSKESTMIASHLGTVFTRLRGLKKLQIYIPLPCMAKAVEILKNAQVELPHIDALFMTGYLEDFLNLFPGVTTLATGLWPPPNKYKPFVHLADDGPNTAKITRLILEKQKNYGRPPDAKYKYEKLQEQLQDALQEMPNLDYLELKDLSCYEAPDIFTQILPGFTNLKHLTLPRGYAIEDEEGFWAFNSGTIPDIEYDLNTDFGDINATPRKQLSFQATIRFVRTLGASCRQLEDLGFGREAWASRVLGSKDSLGRPRRRFHFIRGYDGTIVDMKWRLERWNDGEMCRCETPCDPFRGSYITLNDGDACNRWAAIDYR